MSSIYLKDIIALEQLDDLCVEKVIFLRALNQVELSLSNPFPLTYPQLFTIKKALGELFDGLSIRLVVESTSNETTPVNTRLVQQFLSDFLNNQSIDKALISYDNNCFTLSFANEQDTESIALEQQRIDELLHYLGYRNIQLNFTTMGFNASMGEVNTIKVDQPVSDSNPKDSKPSFNGGMARKGKRVYTEDNLQDINYEKKDVVVECDVFKIDNRVLKKGTTLQILYLVDDYNAITGKRFEGYSCTKEDIDAIKVGMHLKVYGDFVMDTYEKEMTLKINKIEILEVSKMKDNALDKRVELHAHSTISEMDGVIEAADLVKFAYEMGHKGIGICDHVACQEFPKIQRAVASLRKKDPKRDFKAAYGVEMNAVEDHFTIIRNLNEDANLSDLTYCIFDLETTGLSNYFDSIIEFGAVKVKKGVIIDSKQTFINPQRDIPPFISSKTNIRNEDVANAPTIDEIIDELLEFMDGCVLVAHNASFDYPFLNATLSRLGRNPLTNIVIDTLDLARALFPSRKTYRLGNIARQYRISYDEEVAHRADYDAQVLSDVFSALLSSAYDVGVTTLHQLNAINQDKAYLKNRAYHVVLWAKNQAGIKDLYQLVTLSETKTIAVFGKNASEGDSAAEPRILISDIQAHRENLIVSSACQNSKLFEVACNREDALLEETMQFYDVIEIQPLENYRNLLVRNAIPSSEQLKQVIWRIIHMAKKLNIPIIASGDVHYLTPKDKIIRDIYINTLGIGGARHPLYIYDENTRNANSNPDQHYRLTNEMMDCFAWINDDKLIRSMVIDTPNQLLDSMDVCQPVPDGLFPPKIENVDKIFSDICYDTARKTYGDPLPEIVVKRLEKELNSIISNGYAVIYYISHLLVKKSNDDGYLVGSRGSVGSSFAATMSGITEVNPLPPHYVCPKCHYQQWILDDSVASGFDLPDMECPHCHTMIHGNGHNIPFETFLGFYGDKVPDIDLNFSGEYQPKAHLFLREVLGEDHVFRAGTIGTVADKTAFGYVQGYCENRNITNMNKAYKEYLAAKCAGVKRTTGQHPGGIICIPSDMEVEDFTPVQFPANDPSSEWKTTHFDFHDIHDNVLKFDILGHVDPTAMRLLQNISGIDPKSIPMNDPDTISLFSSAQALKADPRYYNEPTGALGLPEFGTRFVRKILEETRPNTFSDLIIISGLSHGTDVWANNAADLIHDKTCSLKDVIGCRDDIMTYLIHKQLPNKEAFTIMESVRKGKGLKPEWIELMKEHDVPQWYIESCLKIKYMFPKAHAIAYVIMAIRIAWFKVHHPTYYYISFFSLRCDAYEIDTMSSNIDTINNRLNAIRFKQSNHDKDLTDKEIAIADTLDVTLEMYARGYRIQPINLYQSLAKDFTVDPNNPKAIIPPFVTIDSLGESVAVSIVKARENGEFLSIEDLKNRTQLSTSLIEKLKKMHVLDGLQERNQMSLF